MHRRYIKASSSMGGMPGRGELTDGAWGRIGALLPANGKRGRQWGEHRKGINGIPWGLRTGAPRRDMPGRYGPWQTCYDRLVRWRRDGTWEKLLEHVQTKSDAVGEIEWAVIIDSTTAGVHQHAAGDDGGPSEADTKGGLRIRRVRHRVVAVGD